VGELFSVYAAIRETRENGGCPFYGKIRKKSGKFLKNNCLVRKFQK